MALGWLEIQDGGIPTRINARVGMGESGRGGGMDSAVMGRSM